MPDDELLDSMKICAKNILANINLFQQMPVYRYIEHLPDEIENLLQLAKEFDTQAKEYFKEDN